MSPPRTRLDALAHPGLPHPTRLSTTWGTMVTNRPCSGPTEQALQHTSLASFHPLETLRGRCHHPTSQPPPPPGRGRWSEGRRTIQADRSLLATPRSPLASPFLTFMTEAPASTSPGSPDGPGSPESPSPAPPPQGFGREPRCVSSGLPSRNQMWKSCTGEAWDKPLTDKEGADRGREPQAARQVWHL